MKDRTQHISYPLLLEKLPNLTKHIYQESQKLVSRTVSTNFIQMSLHSSDEIKVCVIFVFKLLSVTSVG